MVSPTGTRRVLGNLNVNTPVSTPSNPAGFESEKPATPSPLKQDSTAEETSLPRELLLANLPPQDRGEDQMGSRKRSHSHLETDEQPRHNVKRYNNTEYSIKESNGRGELEDAKCLCDAENMDHKHYDTVDDNIDGIDFKGSISPVPASTCSPGSSFTSGQSQGHNDSQMTTLTEPDNGLNLPIGGSFTTVATVAPPPRPTLTKEEAREKLIGAKLRLQLAAYKIKTNQVNVPIDRLEVRSHSSSPSTIPARLATSISTLEQRRTSLPAGIPKVPAIKAQNSSDEINEALLTSIPSSPSTSYQKTNQNTPLASPRKEATSKQDVVTNPLLPRQCAGVLSPPSLMHEESDDDLTSSAVKGSAAAGLLQLGRANPTAVCRAPDTSDTSDY